MKELNGKKRRVIIRLLRKAAQKLTRASGGTHATVILKDKNNVDILKARIIHGKFTHSSLKFNR